MNTLRQEFCDETNTPMGLDNEFDYIRWLEAKIQALRIHDVSGQSEQLCDFLEWYDEKLTLEEREMDIKTYLDMKSHNCH